MAKRNSTEIIKDVGKAIVTGLLVFLILSVIYSKILKDPYPLYICFVTSIPFTLGELYACLVKHSSLNYKKKSIVITLITTVLLITVIPLIVYRFIICSATWSRDWIIFIMEFSMGILLNLPAILKR